MLGIERLIVVGCMASFACGRGARKSISMTFYTLGGGVSASEWKVCGIVIKHTVRTSIGMASQAGCTIITVSGHSIVLLIRFGIGVTRDTSKLSIIAGGGMTFLTIGPHPFMFSAIDREVRAIVIKSSWSPCIFIMTGCTIR